MDSVSPISSFANRDNAWAWIPILQRCSQNDDNNDSTHSQAYFLEHPPHAMDVDDKRPSNIIYDDDDAINSTKLILRWNTKKRSETLPDGPAIPGGSNRHQQNDHNVVADIWGRHALVESVWHTCGCWKLADRHHDPMVVIARDKNASVDLQSSMAALSPHRCSSCRDLLQWISCIPRHFLTMTAATTTTGETPYDAFQHDAGTAVSSAKERDVYLWIRSDCPYIKYVRLWQPKDIAQTDPDPDWKILWDGSQQHVVASSASAQETKNNIAKQPTVRGMTPIHADNTSPPAAISTFSWLHPMMLSPGMVLQFSPPPLSSPSSSATTKDHPAMFFQLRRVCHKHENFEGKVEEQGNDTFDVHDNQQNMHANPVAASVLVAGGVAHAANLVDRKRKMPCTGFQQDDHVPVTDLGESVTRNVVVTTTTTTNMHVRNDSPADHDAINDHEVVLFVGKVKEDCNPRPHHHHPNIEDAANSAQLQGTNDHSTAMPTTKPLPDTELLQHHSALHTEREELSQDDHNIYDDGCQHGEADMLLLQHEKSYDPTENQGRAVMDEIAESSHFPESSTTVHSSSKDGEGGKDGKEYTGISGRVHAQDTSTTIKPAGAVESTVPAASDSQDVNVVIPDAVPALNPFRLYFVPKGRDMSKTLLDGNPQQKLPGLKSHCRQRGAVVLDHFDRNHSITDATLMPTHLVISNQVKAGAVCEALGFESVELLELFLGQHSIVCATRQWAAKGNAIQKPPIEAPTKFEIFLDLVPRKVPNLDNPYTIKSAQVHMKKKGHNEALATLFHQLSKLHQETPLVETDEWRAYSFHILSGRLRHLNFDITGDGTDPAVLGRLREIKGIGTTSMQIITEFLQTGECSRIRELQNDPQRMAMKRMMNIWGVGRVRASELVNAGYDRIGQVRHAINEGRLTFDRNQYIGLLCYEDIMEEMPRTEVEAIFEVVSVAFKKRFPSAEMTIMGSYRRGKEMCGDVDILITHPHHQDNVPPEALGRVIDGLCRDGAIIYHLTKIAGMDDHSFETLPRRDSWKWTQPKVFGNKKRDHSSCSSYMGVFRSPFIPEKHRRVDIKFYPHRERVFASLYFTGNGYFNRAMRLWATRMCDWTLNDHGLFKRDTSSRVMVASNEKEVFDRLGLAWREPRERDCFDAVQASNTGESVVHLGTMSKEQLRRESQEYVWVK